MVRNFWIELDVNGRSIPIETGPARTDGGFDLRISMRSEGKPETVMSIRGIAHQSGSLQLLAFDETTRGDEPGEVNRLEIIRYPE